MPADVDPAHLGADRDHGARVLHAEDVRQGRAYGMTPRPQGDVEEAPDAHGGDPHEDLARPDGGVGTVSTRSTSGGPKSSNTTADMVRGISRGTAGQAAGTGLAERVVIDRLLLSRHVAQRSCRAGSQAYGPIVHTL